MSQKSLECLGPQFRLDLQPLACTIESEDKKITCVPPQLLLIKLPAFCQKVRRQKSFK
jgi:hypothetical protein